MDVMVLENTDDLSRVEALLTEWRESADSDSVPVDTGAALSTLRMLASTPFGTVLALVHEGSVCGFMGVFCSPNHFGPGRIAHECMYFVTHDHRKSSRRLMAAAEKWAKTKGCSHFVVTASRLANPERVERVERYYQACGFAPYESSFIKEIR